MNEIKHTRLSLGRKYYIERSLSQTNGPECAHRLSPIQSCTRKINQLRQHIFKAEEKLEIINRKIENLRYNIPIKLKNLVKSNNKELDTQREFLNAVRNNLEKSIADLNAITLKERQLIEEVEELERQNNAMEIQIEEINYNIFKKGQFIGFLEYEESLEDQEPCHLDKIGKLWSDIQVAEKELLKWQSIDCHKNELHQSKTQMNDEDVNEYLLSFIRDALYHYIMDEGNTRTKQEQLSLLISFFEFNDSETAAIAKNNAWLNRTQSVSW